MTLLDKPVRPEPSNINEAANSYRELSNKEKNDYQVKLDLWKEDMKAYEKQKEDINKVYDIIYSSVAEIH